jgi:hypothetical protein
MVMQLHCQNKRIKRPRNPDTHAAASLPSIAGEVQADVEVRD